MLAIFYGIYSLAPWPVVNMIALICSEFCNDVGIRATQRLLAVCSAKASKKLETCVPVAKSKAGRVDAVATRRVVSTPWPRGGSCRRRGHGVDRPSTADVWSKVGRSKS